MAMGQKESARASLAVTAERVCVVFTSTILTVVSLLFQELMSYQQDLTPGPVRPDSWAWENWLAEASWGPQYWGGGWSVCERSYVPSPFCPPPPDAAVLNLKGLVINSFSLQLLNEPLRRNESSLPASWPPQTDCVRLGARLPTAVVRAVPSQRAVALGDRDVKQTSSAHYS